jgi:hypothetical protein
MVFAAANNSIAALVGYYALNETNNPSLGTSVADSSGNSRNGIMTSDGTPAPGIGAQEGIPSVDPIYGTAFNFSSAVTDRGYVDINPFSGALTRDGALTYAAWIKPAASQLIDSTFTGGTGSGFDFRLVASGLNWNLLLKSGNSASSATSTGTVLSDVWTHVAVTKDANGSAGTNLANVTFYINGVAAGTTTIGRAGSGTPARWFLGSGALTTEYYNGGLDEVRIYNEVLDANAIAALAVVPEPSTAFLITMGVCVGVVMFGRRRLD